MPFRVGFLIFPNITQLDMTGPWEVLSNMPDTVVHLVWKSREPVAAAKGLILTPDEAFETCPPLDLVCVPGGPGVNDLLTDAETLDFLRRQAAGARYVTSVCTGSLVLGAAGLLKGKRAACHWSSRDMLAAFGATPDPARVVIDGNVVTGGGVTAGIDFALTIFAELHGAERAQATQLAIEYAPAPPFAAGRPETAPPEVVVRMRDAMAPMLDRRRAQVERAATLSAT